MGTLVKNELRYKQKNRNIQTFHYKPFNQHENIYNKDKND